jgi:RND family efflux transporter MFP subunit
MQKQIWTKHLERIKEDKHPIMIRNISLIALAALLFTSCEQEDKDLKAKKSELKEAKKELAEIKKKIGKLEQEIADLDTTNEQLSGVLVETIALEAGQFKHYVDVQGTAESESNVLISSEVPGAVGKIMVEEGDRVSNGQLLVSLDERITANSMAEVQTALELATSVYGKQKNLWDQKIGSEIQFLQAKNNKESLEKKLNTLGAQLAKSRIKSPINGVVDEIFLKEGEMAGPGVPVARVVNLDEIYLKADVSEALVGKFQKGDSVSVNFPSLNRDSRGKVMAIGQFINPNNRTFRIEVKVGNEGNMLKPNLLAIIKMNDYSADSVISVPTKYVSKSEQGHFVYVKQREEGISVAKKRIIEVGKTYNGTTEVLTGLNSGDVLISEGSSIVVDGEEIRLK